jgi:hypothetical protein
MESYPGNLARRALFDLPPTTASTTRPIARRSVAGGSSGTITAVVGTLSSSPLESAG